MLLLFGGATEILEYSPADVLRYWLVAEGYGSSPPSLDWPVFATSEPTAPDNCITTYDTGGEDQGRFYADGSRAELYGVQVRVRGKDHNTAFRKAKAIARALDTAVYDDYVAADSTRYLITSAKRTSNVLPIGYDAPTGKRNVCTINVLLRCERVS